MIGHIKNEHRMGRNYLAHAKGDAINAILAAAGYNFSLLLRWLRAFLWLITVALLFRPKPLAAYYSSCSRSTHHPPEQTSSWLGQAGGRD
ncbi:transposase [Mesorhizobium amorphae CCBAU 01583]|nr:transposase [Mesorhizobium amorphae CCBAU 01583]